MISNLIDFLAKDGKAEYSVNLHTIETSETSTKVLYITVTRVDLSIDYDGDVFADMNYTTIFNGLPTPKNLLKCCEGDTDSAKEIIETLKGEDVYEFAAEYWNFDKDEWEDNLDGSLNLYLEKVNESLMVRKR